MFLITTDSFSKWPEIFEVQKTDTENTLNKLREVFSRFGLPNTIVSNNGTPFTSSEFSFFCQYNGIKHLTSPLYHPANNKADKNSVSSLKIGFKKILSNNKNISTHSALCKYLFYYRKSIHTTTSLTLTILMFGRNVITRFIRLRQT